MGSCDDSSGISVYILFLFLFSGVGIMIVRRAS